MQNDEPTSSAESWEHLKELIVSGKGQAIDDYLNRLGTKETARAISRLEEEERSKLVSLLEPEAAADLIEDLPESQAVDIIEDLPRDQAAAIFDELPSNEQADLLGAMDAGEAEQILKQMDPEEAKDARKLLSYPENSAGAVMITELAAYDQSATASQVIEDLRVHAEEYRNFDVLYGYVIDKRGRLLGVLKLRDLVLCPIDTKVFDIMVLDPVKVRPEATIEEMEELFDKHGFFGLPVVDQDGILLGVVRRSSLREHIEEQADKTFLQSAGILGGEELRSLPARTRASRRLIVLLINIGLNLISASVISHYRDTLQAVITLAIFLPIISDLSGCSGNQSIAVSIRELSLGLLRPRDFGMVILKELRVGVMNGLVLGIALFLIAGIWQDNFKIGLVVGLAVAITSTLAVALGGIIPLFLRALRFDPAIASSPLLTTMTDTTGFFIALSLASLGIKFFGGLN